MTTARTPGGPDCVPNCVQCSRPLSGDLAPHLCASCGLPQPLRPGETYFEALGAPVRFQQDPAVLERRFYALSRALHPDRFSTASADARVASLERMSFLNEAYRTLKNPERLRFYLLKLHGIETPEGTGSSKQIPMELAESWFELQEVMMEEPSAAKAKIRTFEDELEKKLSEFAEKVATAEAAFDQGSAREELVRIHDLILQTNYLKSMQRDVQKMAERIK